MEKWMDSLSKFTNVLSPIFYSLIFMSITATLLGMTVFLLRRIFDKKMTALHKFLLWGIVLFALVFPLRFSSEKAILPRVDVPQSSEFRREYKRAERELLIYEQEVLKSDSPIVKKDTSVTVGEDILKKQREVNTLFFKALALDVFLPLLWFIGSLFFLLSLLIGKASLERKLRREGERTKAFDTLVTAAKTKLNLHGEVDIYLLPSMSSPALLGFYKPRIILPSFAGELSEKSLCYVIMHELSHFKRKDMWLNLFLLLLQSIYWFNPLSWLLFKLIREDMEVLTDEFVLSVLDKEEEKAYAYSLVEVLSHTHKIQLMPRLLCMVDGKKNVEKRIKMMGLKEKVKKYKWFIGLGLLLISVVLLALFFTEKKEDEREVLFKLKNLREEEVLDLELVFYNEEKKENLYMDFKGEEKEKVLQLLKKFEGKRNKDFDGTYRSVMAFYLRTVQGDILSVINDEEGKKQTLLLNGKYSFFVDEAYLNEFKAFGKYAKHPVPRNFPRGSERFRGIGIHLQRGDDGRISFGITEGRFRHVINLSKKKREVEKTLSEAFEKFYADNLENIFLLRGKLREKGFTKDDIMEFSAGRYEEGEALFRLQEGLHTLLERYANEGLRLNFEIYADRVSIVIENDEKYLLFENYYDGRIDEKEVSSELSRIQKYYQEAFSALSPNENRMLGDSELQKIIMAFAQLITDAKEGPDNYMMNSLCNFFYAEYGDVKNIDLSSFLWYFGQGEELKQGNPTDEEEFKELKRMGVRDVIDYELGSTITPVQRIKASDVEYILKTYADIGLKDLTNTEGAIYSEKYDHYYVFTSDFGLGQFSPSFGEIKDGELLLEDDGRRLVMKHVDGRWVFKSFTNKVLRHSKTYQPEGFQGKDASFSPHVMLDVDTYRYEFVYNPALSYLPSGNFEVISGDIVKLYDRNLGYFEFRILDEDTLEFISSSIETEKMTFQGVEIKPGMKFLAVKE